MKGPKVKVMNHVNDHKWHTYSVYKDGLFVYLSTSGKLSQEEPHLEIFRVRSLKEFFTDLEGFPC